MSHRLLLFDIDGTLLDTGGAGGGALLDAVEEVLGVSRDAIPPLDLAGATDGGVIRKLFADAGAVLEPSRAEAFTRAYLRQLEIRLAREDFPGRLLDGVPELLDHVKGESRFSIGLLTGNLRAGALLKLERFGIAGHFADGGFGDDGEERNLLGPVAMSRMTAASQRNFRPDQVIVIGDTPKDIACAHAMGARCLAVATGRFHREELAAFDAWRVEDNLRDAVALVQAFGG